MEHTSHEFLRRCSKRPARPGSSSRSSRSSATTAEPFADEVRTDRHGNVFAARFPEGTPADAPRIMLAGHCDQIGLMVQHIDDDGFLYVQPIGGWDMQILLGQYLTVWTKTGPVTGVVARRAIHLLKPEERTRCRTSPTCGWTSARRTRRRPSRWCGTATRSRSRSATGRCATASRPARRWTTRSGCGWCMEAVRLLHGRPLQAAVYGVSTVEEEIGLRGATTARLRASTRRSASRWT